MSFAANMKTIVVATDLGSQSEAALEYARKLAGAYGARIVLAHGVDPLDYAVVDAVPGRLLKGLTEKARAALDELCGKAYTATRRFARAWWRRCWWMWRGNMKPG
jgi:nucleotide-binding universal stress UspA family protein